MRPQPSDDRLNAIILETFNSEKPEKSDQLVALVSSQIKAPEQEIRNAITTLQEQGVIALEKQVSMTEPVKASDGLWYLATLIIGVATLASVFTIPVDEPPLSYFRTIFGFTFAFWLPGFTCLKALYPGGFKYKSSVEGLSSIAEFGLSIGLSIVLTPMVGLVLYFTPIGLDMSVIVISVFALTAIFATIGFIRERRLAKKPVLEIMVNNKAQ